MAFTLPNYPTITFEQANPILGGLRYGNEIRKQFSDLLSQQLEQQKAKKLLPFVEPSAQAQLKAAQLANLWNPQIWQSEIGLRGSQANRLNTLTPLEAQELRIKNQFAPEMNRADIQKQRMISGLLESIMSGQQQPLEESPMAPALQRPVAEPTQERDRSAELMQGLLGQSQGTAPQAGYSTTQPGQEPISALEPQAIQQVSQQLQQARKPSISYPQAAVASKLLGLGEPKIIDVDGKKIAVTPFGNIDIAQGQNAFEKKLSEKEAERVYNLEDTSLNADTKLQTLNELSDVIASPEYQQMRQHPGLGMHEIQYYRRFGTPDQQNIAGKFETLTGQIVKDAAADFKGQFRVGEQALLNSMKVSASDSLDAARGKAEEMAFLVKMMGDRAKVQARLIRQGADPLDAKEMADSAVSGEDVRKAIKERLKGKSTRMVPIRNKATGEVRQVSIDEAKKMGVPGV